MARPGVLFYFDMLSALDQLPYAAAGELMLKALHYARDGMEPVFEDGSLSFAWQFVKASVDRDGAAYDEKRQRGDWLTYCRRCKRDGIEAADFETWRERTDNVALRGDNVVLPTTDPTTTTTTAPTPESETNTHGADKPPKKRFVPPTLDEIAGYVAQRGSSVDARTFFDYYEAAGWKDARGNGVKSWKQKLITWKGRSGDGQRSANNRGDRGESAKRDFGVKYD